MIYSNGYIYASVCVYVLLFLLQWRIDNVMNFSNTQGLWNLWVGNAIRDSFYFPRWDAGFAIVEEYDFIRLNLTVFNVNFSILLHNM